MTQLHATRPAVPVAVLGNSVPSVRTASGMAREVIVTIARAAIGAKVYLESQPVGGPRERIRAFALPVSTRSPEERAYRAVLPALPPGTEAIYVPLVVQGGQEIRGEALRLTTLPAPAPSRPSTIVPSPARVEDPARVKSGPVTADAPPVRPLAFPAMELLAHVRSHLTGPTIFGATPEGVQLAFYIVDGWWTGRVRAHYRSEGGDWILIRRDGVGIPNARATLETEDGSLLYYQLTGTVDLGPNGYERTLANDFPHVAAFSVVAKISTSSARWNWLNRLAIVGAGTVSLKTATVCYDIYSIACDPSALFE